MTGTALVALALSALLLSFMFSIDGALTLALLAGAAVAGASVLPLVDEARSESRGHAGR